jgi:hypothetical protein
LSAVLKALGLRLAVQPIDRREAIVPIDEIPVGFAALYPIYRIDTGPSRASRDIDVAV